MGRYFNTEGECRPDIHYMVRLDDRVRQIKELYVEKGKYFVINRGRQYGKTTTLAALAEYLRQEYFVLSMDFQKISNSCFENEHKFVQAFIRQLEKLLKDRSDLLEALKAVREKESITMDQLFDALNCLCETSGKPVVLLIDEVDSASNNQVFLDFLAQLRGDYLNRNHVSTFHSVILAGLYDIKNFKLKIRPESEHHFNCPWNIAAKFDMDMAFSAGQIAGMLEEYEADYHTGMDIRDISQCIYDYTSGYPCLVSTICKMLDEDIPRLGQFGDRAKPWSREGIEEAVRNLLKENLPLFDSMAKQLDAYPDMRSMIEEIVYQGKRVPFSLQAKPVNLGVMLGFLKEENGGVAVSNRIFEMVLLNMFMAEEALDSRAFQYGDRDRNLFVSEGRLDMDFVLEKFVEYFHDIFGDSDERFLEKNGRKFFLLFLKPIINGTGNYYLESETRDARRTDVIVDYRGEQFVIEMKIWHGDEYNKRGETQLAEYLDYYHLEKGYMLSFNFNKNKETGVKEIRVGDKIIVEAVV